MIKPIRKSIAFNSETQKELESDVLSRKALELSVGKNVYALRCRCVTFRLTKHDTRHDTYATQGFTKQTSQVDWDGCFEAHTNLHCPAHARNTGCVVRAKDVVRHLLF